jgi:hypothetical protein
MSDIKLWTGKDFNDNFVKKKGLKFYRTISCHTLQCKEVMCNDTYADKVMCDDAYAKNEGKVKSTIDLKEGENEWVNSSCMASFGFLFTPEKYIGKFWCNPTYLCEVNIPDDAIIYEHTKNDEDVMTFTTLKFILSNPIPIKKWIKDMSKEKREIYKKNNDILKQQIEFHEMYANKPLLY